MKLDQGLQLLKLFKEHASKTCILDDFDFYETRQKVMQEKRTKQQQLQKKACSDSTFSELCYTVVLLHVTRHNNAVTYTVLRYIHFTMFKFDHSNN